MLCQACNKIEAEVHVTSLQHSAADAAQADAQPAIHQQHFCDACAQQQLKLHSFSPSLPGFYKLLQQSQNQQRARREVGLTCPDCGMTVMDFRQKGRLGCPKDYEVFGAQLRDLLERIHGATHHVGRGPGSDEAVLKRMQRVSELQHALDAAIREEAYEAAAKLRDEIRALQQS